MSHPSMVTSHSTTSLPRQYPPSSTSDSSSDEEKKKKKKKDSSSDEEKKKKKKKDTAPSGPPSIHYNVVYDRNYHSLRVTVVECKVRNSSHCIISILLQLQYFRI